MVCLFPTESMMQAPRDVESFSRYIGRKTPRISFLFHNITRPGILRTNGNSVHELNCSKHGFPMTASDQHIVFLTLSMVTKDLRTLRRNSIRLSISNSNSQCVVQVPLVESSASPSERSVPQIFRDRLFYNSH